MKPFFLSCLLVFLVACTSQTPPAQSDIPVNQALLHAPQLADGAGINIESETDIFQLSDAMRAMVQQHLLPIRDVKKRTEMLIRQIFLTRNLGLLYQGNANLIAADTYKNAKANCLSLTIMAYALAQEARLPVQFQQVQIPEYWVREGDYNLLTGHVNLIVTPGAEPSKMTIYGNNNMLIDFDPFVAKKQFPAKAIEQNTVVAMYYNNKGAQALITKQYAQAYQYFEAAVMKQPGFSSAWGNLALLYRLQGLDQLAQQTYRYALSLDNENYTVLTNLAILLKQQGDNQEYAKINAFIERKRDSNPYYHAMLADEAAFAGQLEAAVKHYKHAIKLDAKVHEFYAGLAKVYARLHEYDRASRAIKKALALNKFADIEAQYLAKLNLLQQHYDN